MKRSLLAPVVLSLSLAGCLGPDTSLASTAPALVDFEEPLSLAQEPDDEAARRALPAGTFSGIEVEDARDSLEALAGEEGSVRVARVVENSPAQVAGVTVGDLLLSVDDGRSERVVRARSEWRALELEAAPGTRLVLVLERLGREREVELVLEERVAPAARVPSERLREEQRVGVLLRTETEVEARADGLGPGAGAVVIGLARSSPWRAAGVQMGDRIVAVDGEPLSAAERLIERIERGQTGERLRLSLRREAEELEVEAPLARRGHELQSFGIPLLASYRSQGERTSWSLLLGIVRWKSTSAAWQLRLFWLIRFGGGDSDRLIEVRS